jgi:hypothetical protein
MEQTKFLACGHEFSVEFSAPPEFSGGITEKYIFEGQRFAQIFCTAAPLSTNSYDIHCVPSWDFPAGSGSYLPGFSGHICSYWKPNFPAVSGSYLPGLSGRICSYWQPNFPAVSVVTCRDFLALPFLVPEGRDFPAVSVVDGRDFPAEALLAWVI